MPVTNTGAEAAVLISGGLDSAILLGDYWPAQARVQPLFIRCGLSWESIEEAYLRDYLQALARPNLRPLVVLEQPVADIYGQHWSMTGQDVPAAEAADEAVFLPGRNLLLLGKAMLWCHLHKVPAVALGSLQTNPFPDATPAFFRSLQDLVNQAVHGSVQILVPFGGLSKEEVMRRGAALPLQYTFSCIRPKNRLHCGQCNKCAERRRAFTSAHMTDPTTYAL